MKNLINKLPLMAFVLGLGLVVSTSAFTTKMAAPNYGKYSGPGSVNGWIPLSGLTEGEDPGQYMCDVSSNICTGYFSSQPSSPNQTPTSDIRRGTFLVAP